MKESYKVTVGGVEYSLRLSIKSMRNFEELMNRDRAAGEKKISFIEGTQELSITAMSYLFRVILNDGNGGTEEEADELFDELGFESAMNVVNSVMEVSFPQEEKASTGKKPRAAARR